MRKEFVDEVHHKELKYPWVQGFKNFMVVSESFNIHPDSYVLEIGCEAGSFGIHMIPTLRRGRYHGIEKNIVLAKGFLDYELKINKLEKCTPTIVVSDNIDFSVFKSHNKSCLAVFDYMFDFMTGYYDPLTESEDVIREVARFLKPNTGRFITLNNDFSPELLKSYGCEVRKTMSKVVDNYNGNTSTQNWSVIHKKQKK